MRFHIFYSIFARCLTYIKRYEFSYSRYGKQRHHTVARGVKCVNLQVYEWIRYPLDMSTLQITTHVGMSSYLRRTRSRSDRGTDRRRSDRSPSMGNDASQESTRSHLRPRKYMDSESNNIGEYQLRVRKR